ncbi:MAG TPA: fumarate reductase/succinate dehydrogenase flavoprotein subunit, partial [Acidimicrobiia bacterium]|nr:fumarate reductase/succinate dehydrogenase flavoprotein subunit [Acidimicrobiia bacterium]
MTIELNSGVPSGPMAERWQLHKDNIRLVNPKNKRRFKVIIVGSGLAGASAAATLAELGYQVEVFTYHDSPRRAHSISAQGGINAAKNYRNDGDSVFRLFYDTVKGGDFRAREPNVHRLAEVSVNIIDQCVAQGVPFAREYSGLLDNRSFGGAQVSRTFYARGQTGQQLLLGAYQQMMRQVKSGTVKLNTRSEMLDLVVKDGRAVGIITRDLVSGEIGRHSGHAVVLATGGYSNVFFLSTNAKACNTSAIWRAHRRGAAFANPCFTQIHPTCIPQNDEFQSKLTLMSESLRNDARIWVPKAIGDERPPHQIPEEERDYFLERMYPAFGNLVPRDVASRAVKRMVDSGRGVGPRKNGVYLDFADAINRWGRGVIEERYGNLFEMYERITDQNPYEMPMRIYPAPHYTMGGLWVDYNLMTTIPGLYAIGEANFSDHGANRLGASALMQGLADGYFVLPYTLGDYLAGLLALPATPLDDPAFATVQSEVTGRVEGYLSGRGTRTVDWFHRELGKIMWEYCGMSRDRTGLEKALSEIPALYEEFRRDL